MARLLVSVVSERKGLALCNYLVLPRYSIEDMISQ